VALHVAVSAVTFEVPAAIADGVTDGLKKAAGYVTVMVEPMGNAVVGVKDSVTVADVLKAMRSAVAMSKDTAVTWV
jgi:hypothetical protein